MHNRKIWMAGLVLALCASLSAQGGSEKEADAASAESLVVYATDAFTSEWGPGPKIAAAFEKATGIAVDMVNCGSSAEIIPRVISEKNDPQSDVVIAITDDLAGKLLEADVLEPYDCPALETVPSFVRFDKTNRIIPYDWGDFGFVYDSQKLSEDELPRSLDDLCDPKYKGKIILCDPRTSAVGMGMLVWTYEVYGEKWLDWWKAVKPNVLTIADGWSSAYGLFTEGEAPIVLSYTTSPVYHVLNENGNTRYRALIFPEGHALTIQGMALTKGARHPDLGKKFIDFVLTEGQVDSAIADSMYPANSTIELPDAYAWAPVPDKQLSLDGDFIRAHQDAWLDAWQEAMGSN